MMERICIYNRCSTEEENQKNALEIQAQESVEIVKQHACWQIVDQFVESQSGTTSVKRSKYQQMLKGIEQRKYTIVVIKSIDRLVRNTKDWYLFLDCIVRNNTRLYIYIDNKFYSSEDSLITGIKAILAEEFSRELSKKIKNAHKRRQTNKSGYNICSEMFGWNKISKDIYEINEEEANAIRQAYDLIDQGYGFERISKEMFQRGVRSRNHKKIAPTTWRKILRSPRMYGTVVLHRTEYDFNLHKVVQIPETEWVLCEDALPPIVSREYYYRMLGIMDKRSRECMASDAQAMPKSIGAHELSGKIFCGLCGNVFYRRKQSLKDGKRAVWVCSNYINKGTKQEDNPEGCQGISLIEDVLKEFIFKAYVERFNSLEGSDRYLVDETVRILRSTLSGADYISKIKNLEREYKKLQRNKDKTFEKLMNGVLSDQDYKIFVGKINEQIQKTSIELDAIRLQMSGMEDLEKRLLEIKEELKQGDVIKEVLKAEVIGKVQEITVHEDLMLDICFDKYKVSVCEECNAGEDLYTVSIRYEYVYEGDKQLVDMRKRMKEYIMAKEQVTVKEIMEVFDVSHSRAYSRLRELKAEGVVEYERNRQGGYWYLFKEKI